MEHNLKMGVESCQGLGCMVRGFGDGFWSGRFGVGLWARV